MFADYYSTLAIAHANTGNPTQAMQYFVVNDSIVELYGDPKRKLNSKFYMGTIFCSIEDFEHGIPTLKRAKAIIDDNGIESPLLSPICNNLTSAFFTLNELDSDTRLFRNKFEQFAPCG